MKNGHDKSLSEYLAEMTGGQQLVKVAGAGTPSTGVDEIYELLKTASADQTEFDANCSAGGRIVARAMFDEFNKIAAELPAEVIANIPPSAPISSQELSEAASVVAATAATLTEQNMEKDEQVMRLTSAKVMGNDPELNVMIDELLNSNDQEKQALGKRLAGMVQKNPAVPA